MTIVWSNSETLHICCSFLLTGFLLSALLASFYLYCSGCFTAVLSLNSQDCWIFWWVFLKQLIHASHWETPPSLSFSWHVQGPLLVFLPGAVSCTVHRILQLVVLRWLLHKVLLSSSIMFYSCVVFHRKGQWRTWRNGITTFVPSWQTFVQLQAQT